MSSDKFLWSIVAIIIVLFVIGGYFYVKSENDFSDKCLQAGGVYLKNSRYVTKNTWSTSYVCIKKEAVIDLEHD